MWDDVNLASYQKLITYSECCDAKYEAWDHILRNYKKSSYVEIIGSGFYVAQGKVSENCKTNVCQESYIDAKDRKLKSLVMMLPSPGETEIDEINSISNIILTRRKRLPFKPHIEFCRAENIS